MNNTNRSDWTSPEFEAAIRKSTSDPIADLVALIVRTNELAAKSNQNVADLANYTYSLEARIKDLETALKRSRRWWNR